MKKIFILPLLLLAILPVASQNNDLSEIYNSAEFIEKGIEWHDQENYENALTMYRKVDITDPKYLTAQYEIILSLSALNKTDDQKKLLEELYHSGAMEEKPDLYMMYGIFLSDNKEYEQAEKMLKKAEKHIPFSSSLNYNFAILYIRMEDRQKSIDYLKKTITYNPNHASSHYLLGLLALEDGRISQGCLALLGYLVNNPNGYYAKEAIIKLNTKMGQDFLETPKLTFSQKDDDFSELDVILRNQLPLNPKYKLKIKLDDVLPRQVQAITEYAATHKIKDGFFENTYIPWLADIANKKNTEAFIYYILISMEETLGKSLTSEKKRIIHFAENYLAHDFWALYATRKIDHFGKTEAVTIWLQNGKPYIIGKKENGQNNGKFKIVNEHGQMVSELDFKNGELEGLQRYYNEKGKLIEETFYKNGLKNGSSTDYYTNENLKAVENYKDEELHGKAVYYTINGGVDCELTFEKGNRHGQMICYYPDGSVKRKAIYENNNIQGKYIEYNEVGDIITDFNYNNGQADGKCYEYYDGSVIKNELVFEKGTLLSKKSYHEDSTLEAEWIFASGIPVYYVSYLFEGKKSKEIHYTKKGDFEKILYYNADGNLFYEEIYKNNSLIKGIQYSENGSSKETTIGNKQQMKNLKGITTAEGGVKKGQLEGEWKYFYGDGQLKLVENYQDGKLQGIRKEYNLGQQLNTQSYLVDGEVTGKLEGYKNGTLEKVISYNANVLDGPFKYLYPDGTTSYQGFYTEGTQHGKYFSYRTDGSLLREYQYFWGSMTRVKKFSEQNEIEYELDHKNLNGLTEYKSCNNNLTTTTNFINGKQHGQSLTKDKKGTPVSEIHYHNGNYHGLYKKYHPNGKPEREAAYYNGNYHGIYKNFDLTGTLRFQTEYKHGMCTASRIRFYHNGKKLYQYEENKGVKHGEYTYYNLEERPIAVIIYNSGLISHYRILNENNELSEPISILTHTIEIISKYSNGQTAFSVSFKNGILHGTAKIFSPDGKPIYSCDFSEDNIHGERKEYYANGKIYKIERLRQDLFEGVQEYFDTNGAKIIEANYKFNELHGDFIVYKNNNVQLVKKYNSDDLVEIKP